MKNHLIYHLCPLVRNDGWLRNLEQLGRRIDLFDGERVIAVAQGEGCHDLLEVKVQLIGYGINAETAPVENDPVTREVKSFLPLLELASTLDGNIFYAHSKGNSTADGERGAARWRNAMYDHLLRSEILESLDRHRMVGACLMTWDSTWRRRHGHAWRCPFPVTPGKRQPIEPHNKWLFAGTFFWFTPHVFTLDWRGAIDSTDRYGAECWPGNMYRRDEIVSVYQPRPDYEPWNPYDPRHYEGQYDD